MEQLNGEVAVVTGPSKAIGAAILEHRYPNELSVTGLTSNPTIFDHTIKDSTAYDEVIPDGLRRSQTDGDLFSDLVLDDITRAVDMFRPAHETGERCRLLGVTRSLACSCSPKRASNRVTIRWPTSYHEVSPGS